MNYIKIYNQIIRKAKARDLPKDVYSERHHILPTSIFGKNNRVVRLLPKEHFICHFLLFKYCKRKYGLNHWKTSKMGYAFYKMTISSDNQKRYTSRSYQVIKEWYSINNPSKSQAHRDRMKGNTYGSFRRGLKQSDKTKEKISKANTGKLAGDKNPSKRLDVRQKISEKRKNVPIPSLQGENNPKFNHNISIEERRLLRLEWLEYKEKGESLYSFANRYAEKYNVSRGMIQSIVYLSPNASKAKKELFNELHGI